MANEDDLLKITELAIGYDQHILVDGISLVADVGMFVLLVGANGKGKSTLLKTIAGQHLAIKGEVYIGGLEVSKTPLDLLAKQVSFLSGNVALPNEVTVNDLLEFARIPYLGRIKGVSDNDRAIIKEVVKELEIKTLIDKSYMALSDGQKQLVNIARSLVQQTPIIVLDEPTAHLDVVNKRKIFQLLKQQAENGKLIVCSSHDLQVGQSYADAAWVIDKTNSFQVIQQLSEMNLAELEELLF